MESLRSAVSLHTSDTITRVQADSVAALGSRLRSAYYSALRGDKLAGPQVLGFLF